MFECSTRKVYALLCVQYVAVPNTSTFWLRFAEKTILAIITLHFHLKIQVDNEREARGGGGGTGLF